MMIDSLLGVINGSVVNNNRIIIVKEVTKLGL